MLATCHTQNCGNAGLAIEVGDLTYELDGETLTSTVVCGPCGQPITDVTDSPAGSPEPA